MTATQLSIYDLPLKPVAGPDRTPALIAREVDQIMRRTKETITLASIAIGYRLIEAKRLEGHGGWLPWLAARGINDRTARRAMELASHHEHLTEEHPDQLPSFVTKSLRQALAIVREDRVASGKARRPRQPTPPAGAPVSDAELTRWAQQVPGAELPLTLGDEPISLGDLGPAARQQVQEAVAGSDLDLVRAFEVLAQRMADDPDATLTWLRELKAARSEALHDGPDRMMARILEALERVARSAIPIRVSSRTWTMRLEAPAYVRGKDVVPDGKGGFQEREQPVPAPEASPETAATPGAPQAAQEPVQEVAELSDAEVIKRLKKEETMARKAGFSVAKTYGIHASYITMAVADPRSPATMQNLREALRQVERSDALRAEIQARGLTAEAIGLGGGVVALLLEGAPCRDLWLDNIEAAMAKLAAPPATQAAPVPVPGATKPAADLALADTVALGAAIKASLEGGETIAVLARRAQQQAKGTRITPAVLEELIAGKIVSYHARDALWAVLGGRGRWPEALLDAVAGGAGARQIKLVTVL